MGLEARIIEVIETDDLRGRGTEESPLRRVRQLWSRDGKLLHEDEDPFERNAADGLVTAADYAEEQMRRADKAEARLGAVKSALDATGVPDVDIVGRVRAQPDRVRRLGYDLASSERRSSRYLSALQDVGILVGASPGGDVCELPRAVRKLRDERDAANQHLANAHAVLDGAGYARDDGVDELSLCSRIRNVLYDLDEAKGRIGDQEAADRVLDTARECARKAEAERDAMAETLTRAQTKATEELKGRREAEQEVAELNEVLERYRSGELSGSDNWRDEADTSAALLREVLIDGCCMGDLFRRIHAHLDGGARG